MVQQRLLYLLRSILNFNQKRQCPNCAGRELAVVDSKFFFTKLYNCNACKLNFRFPVDTKQFLEKFYQSEYQADYSEYTQTITHLPSDEELEKMMSNNFYGKRDYAPYMKALLKSNSAKVADFGCSWGYSIFQLTKAGFDAQGFEISKLRATFGKKLNVVIHHTKENVRGNNDLIMTSHAIEHMTAIQEFINFVSSKLTKDGIFMSLCPNGSPEYRARQPEVFHVNWGFLHPSYLTVEFAAQTFRKNPYLILTDDWQYNFKILEEWDGKSQVIGEKLDGQELLIIAKPNQIL
jgi:hypothetical protein